QPAPTYRIGGGDAAHHRSATDIDPDAPRVEARPQLLSCFAAVRIERHFFEDERSLPPDDLHGFRQFFPQDGRSQDVVAGDRRLQRTDKIIQPLPRVEGHQFRIKIDITLRTHQVMEEKTFLQRSRRVDVLDVSRSSWRHRHYPIYLRLLQLHQ